jgi:hypothetical protein
MKLLSTILLLFVATSALATDIKLFVDADGIVKEPVCVINSAPVHYYPVSSTFLQKNRASVAIAMVNPQTRMPGIHYDPAVLKRYSPEFQMWVFMHECAHWELGHLSRPYIPSLLSSEYEENDADCKAAHKLVRYGFSENQLNKVLEEIEIEQNRLFQFIPAPPPGVTKKPLDGKARALHARSCMEEAFR